MLKGMGELKHRLTVPLRDPHDDEQRATSAPVTGLGSRSYWTIGSARGLRRQRRLHRQRHLRRQRRLRRHGAAFAASAARAAVSASATRAVVALVRGFCSTV